MLDESASIKAMIALQQDIAESQTLEGLRQVTAAFAHTHLSANAADLINAPEPVIEPAATMLYLPIGRTGQVLHLQSARAFTDDEAALARIITDLLATSPFFLSQQSSSQTETLQRANQLETIHQVTASALALQSLEATLSAIQKQLVSHFNATECYVVLLDS